MRHLLNAASAYYRLELIDGTSLPLHLEYGDGQCVVTDGDLVLRRADESDSDGVICIRLFGNIFGFPQIQQIFLEREPYDRIDAAHLTFPGGWRHRQGMSPHSVVRPTDDGLKVVPLRSEKRRRHETFRPHTWHFVASSQFLPDSDAAGDER